MIEWRGERRYEPTGLGRTAGLMSFGGTARRCARRDDEADKDIDGIGDVLDAFQAEAPSRLLRWSHVLQLLDRPHVIRPPCCCRILIVSGRSVLSRIVTFDAKIGTPPAPCRCR